MTIDFEHICLKVCDIARLAGSYIAQERKNFSSNSIEYKGDQNLVSYVDKTAEKIILGELTQLLPEAKVLAEESTSEELEAQLSTLGDEELLWVVDPLDGTTNFIHALPPYCVSIALVQGRKPVVGVIYEITSGECYSGWRGSKCYINDQEVRVSDISEVKQSLVITGIAYNIEDGVERFNKAFNYFNRYSNGTRRVGSAAANLAYVAAGRAECFFQWNLSPWDVAAGALLVECAGGKVVDYNKGDNYIFGRSIIATNNNSHQKFLDILCEEESF